MKTCIVAVGQRMPDWAQTAYDDFAKRFPPEHRVLLKTVKAEPRTTGKSAAAMMLAERSRIEAAIPDGARVVALDERGSTLSTVQLATQLKTWEREAPQVAFIIGGPDGLGAQLKAAAHQRLRLSDMTLPHAFARVLLIEQLYRAWSINANHPYHRE